MTAEHDKKRTAQHVDRLMARLKAAERERDELRAAYNDMVLDCSAVSEQRRLVIADLVAERDKLRAAPVAQIPDEATLPMLKAYGDALQAGCELDGSTVWRVMLAAARGVELCSCDQRGIGAQGVSCGDCPRDYGSNA